MVDKDTEEKFLTYAEIIKRARERGVDLGKGIPYNRLRYYTKIGLLPKASRKSFGATPEGCYPEWVVDRLVEINKQLAARKSIQEILKAKELLPFGEIIRLAKKRGVDFGKGDPVNRLRYYTKIGLLPKASRKSFGGTPQGCYRGWVVDRLAEIDKDLAAGKSVQEIARELKAKEARPEIEESVLPETSQAASIEPEIEEVVRQEPIPQFQALLKPRLFQFKFISFFFFLWIGTTLALLISFSTNPNIYQNITKGIEKPLNKAFKIINPGAEDEFLGKKIQEVLGIRIAPSFLGINVETEVGNTLTAGILKVKNLAPPARNILCLNDTTLASCPADISATTFLGLADTPNSFAASANKLVAVNATSNALEFATPLVTNLADKTAADTITGDWVNTANPWADNEVADNLTISSSGSVTWSALTSYPTACSSGSFVTTLADSPTCSTSYATIQDEGTALTARSTINFIGSSISCADSSGNSRTDCTLTSAGAALSSITAATAANSINNGDNAQTWNWAITTADKVGFTFGENTASTATGTPAILRASTLASSTAIPLYIQNLGAAASFRVDDAASDTTPFLIDAAGNIGIGTTTPDSTLHVIGGICAESSDSGCAAGAGDLALAGGDLTTTATTFNLVNATATTINFGGGATTALNIGNGNTAYTAINIGSGTGGNTINIAGTGATGADTINIGTGGTSADTITIGNNASSTSIALTSGTGSQTFTSSVVSGTGTSSAFVFQDSALTTGYGLYGNFTGLTTGSALYLASSSTAGGASGSSYLVNLSRSGANSNASHSAYGISSSVTNSGTTSTNFAGYFSASGATTANYAIYSAAGTNYLAGTILTGLTASRFVTTDSSSNLATTGTSAFLTNTLSDETGSGFAVFATSPQITTSLTTDSTTFALVNTTATTVNFAGAATTLSIGASTGTTTVNNALAVTGNTTLTGTLTANGAATFNTDVDMVFAGTENLSLTSSPTANAGVTTDSVQLTLTTPAHSAAGTNVHNALDLDATIGNATAGTNTVNMISIGALTGDAEVTLYGLNIGALTGTAATEYAITVGSGWDSVLRVNGTEVINGSGLVVAGQLTGTLFTLDGDDADTEAIAQGNTLLIAGGTNGIDTDVSATDTITLNLDYTEIAAATFGSGSGFTWTFDAGATDPTLAFASNSVTLTSGTFALTGAQTISSTLAVTGITTLTGNLNANGGLDVDDVFVVADGGAVTANTDVDFTLASAENFTLTVTTPTVDAIAASLGTSTTDGVDGLQLTFGVSAASGNVIDITPSYADATAGATSENYFVIDIDAFTATQNAAGDTGEIRALNVGNLTQTETAGTITASAIRVGTGWDGLLNYNGTTVINGSGQVVSTQITGTLLTLDGDDADTQTIVQGDTLLVAGGTNGIDTDVSATDTITLNLDTTEIAAATFGSGSGFTWTFDAGATDPALTFGSNALTIASAATITATGVTAFNCTDCIDFDDLEDTLDIDATTSINTTATTTTPLTYNANSLTTGTALLVSADALTTGRIIDVDETSTFTATTTVSGSQVVLTRSITQNAAATTTTVSGDMLSIASSGTETAGDISDTSNILSLSQNCGTGVSCTGAVLDITNAGTGSGILLTSSSTGDLATLNTSGSGTTANGLLIQQTGAGTITDAIDVSDETITNALNIGDNTILGLAAAIDFTEFDVSASTGSITINDGGDAGNISIEGTVLDINSLDFTGAGTLTTGAGTNLTFTPGTTGDLVFSTDADTVATFNGSAEGTANVTLTAGDLTITDGDLILSGGEISATTDDTTTTGFTFTANTITTGTGLSLSSSGLTSGNLFDLGNTSTSATSGDLIQGDHTATYTTAQTVSGNLLDLSRALTINAAATTLTVTGAVATISDNCTVTAGTCTNSANVLSLTQSYTSASGAVLNIAQSGTGADIAFNTTPILRMSDGGTMTWDDATNTLAQIVDNGTTGNLIVTGVIEAGGTTAAAYNRLGTATAGGANIGASNDLLISDSLEVDGTLYLDGTTVAAANVTAFNCTDCIDFDDISDTPTLDATTTLAFSTLNLNLNLSSTGVLNIQDAGVTYWSFDDDSTVDVTFPAAGTLAIDASTTANTTINAGVLDLNVTSATDNNRGFDLAYTFNNTSALTNGYGIYNLTTHSNSTNANTAYGQYSTLVDSVALGNTNFGYAFYGNITGDVAATKNAYGIYSDVLNDNTTTNQGTRNTYAGYFSARGSFRGTATTYGIYTTATGVDTSFGVYGSATSAPDLGGGAYGLYGLGTSTADTGAAISVYGVYGSATRTGATVATQLSTGGFFTAVGDSGGASVARGVSAQASGADTNVGVDVFSMSTAETRNYGLRIQALSGAVTAVYGINIGTLTAGTGASVFGITTGALTIPTSGVTGGQLVLGAISGPGTTSYGITIGANTSTATTNYGIDIGAVSGAGTTNYGLLVGAVSGATTNYQIYMGAAPNTANTAGLCWDDLGDSQISDCSSAPTDLAENFGTSDPSIEAGDVVVLSGEASEAVGPRDGSFATKASIVKSSNPYEQTLIGVVSTNPNILFGDDDLFSPEENPRPVSLSGRVPVKVTDEGGPIATGDLLTSSSTPGVAMKATKPGRVIGMALQSLNCSTNDQGLTTEETTNAEGLTSNALDKTCTGKIIVFVNLTFYLGSLTETGSLAVDAQTDGLFDQTVPIEASPSATLEATESATLTATSSAILSTNDQGLTTNDQGLTTSALDLSRSTLDIIIQALKSIGITIKDGLLAVREAVVDRLIVKEVLVDNSQSSEAEKPAVGQAVVTTGTTEIEIGNSKVNQNSRIFVSFRGEPAEFGWSIGKITDGRSFTVKISKVLPFDLVFDYWIIQTTAESEQERSVGTEQQQTQSHSTVEDQPTINNQQTTENNQSPGTDTSPSTVISEQPVATESAQF